MLRCAVAETGNALRNDLCCIAKYGSELLLLDGTVISTIRL